MTRRRATAVLQCFPTTCALSLALALLSAGCATHTPVVTSSPQATSTPSGLLLTTGSNDAGQLGRPAPTGIRDTFDVVGRDGLSGAVSGVVDAAGGRSHSLALLHDGTVLAWGANDVGQLGDGTKEDTSVPVRVVAADGEPGHLTGVVQVAADSDFSMALLDDGTVVTWGKGNRSQRGTGELRSEAPTPTSVRDIDGEGLLTGVVQISADGNTEMARLADGTLVGWGDSSSGQLGTSAELRQPLPVVVTDTSGAALTDVVDVAVGGQHVLALKGDGTVLAWGANEMRQLGDGTTEDRPAATTVLAAGGGGPLTDVVDVDAAEKHNIALLADGRVVTWGNNTGGQLGAGDFDEKPLPVAVVGRSGADALTGVASVHAGEAYTVAVLEDGTPVTWGAGRRGQLGDGARETRPRPGPVVIEDTGRLSVTSVGTGERHLLLAVD